MAVRRSGEEGVALVRAEDDKDLGQSCSCLDREKAGSYSSYGVWCLKIRIPPGCSSLEREVKLKVTRNFDCEDGHFMNGDKEKGGREDLWVKIRSSALEPYLVYAADRTSIRRRPRQDWMERGMSGAEGQVCESSA